MRQQGRTHSSPHEFEIKGLVRRRRHGLHWRGGLSGSRAGALTVAHVGDPASICSLKDVHVRKQDMRGDATLPEPGTFGSCRLTKAACFLAASNEGSATRSQHAYRRFIEEQALVLLARVLYNGLLVRY